MASPFSYRLAQEIAAEFRRHEVKYLFLGKSGAIILGFPDTTQDADLFVEKSADNCRALVRALVALGFPLDETRQDAVLRGKDFVQLREGPFDLDLVFAPDGIETFAEAEKRSLVVDGLPVCHIDDNHPQQGGGRTGEGPGGPAAPQGVPGLVGGEPAPGCVLRLSALHQAMTSSSDDIMDHFARDVGQAEAPAVVREGELAVVHPEEVEDRRVEVVDADPVDH